MVVKIPAPHSASSDTGKEGEREPPYLWMGMQVLKTPPNHTVSFVATSKGSQGGTLELVGGRSLSSALAFAHRAGGGVILFSVGHAYHRVFII